MRANDHEAYSADIQEIFKWLTKTQGYSETDAKNMIVAAENLISVAEGEKIPLPKQRTKGSDIKTYYGLTNNNNNHIIPRIM